MEPLKFLSDNDVKAMHEATLQVLSDVGVIWTHKPSLDILTDAGCTIKGNRVCFPPDLVMDSIVKANKRPCIRGRNGQVNELGGGRQSKMPVMPFACSTHYRTVIRSHHSSRRQMCLMN
jgi:trimethylamine:corrinoid methyltransferase-like protein